MTNEDRAKLIAAEANKCCRRSDGYEQAIFDLALKMMNDAVLSYAAHRAKHHHCPQCASLPYVIDTKAIEPFDYR